MFARRARVVHRGGQRAVTRRSAGAAGFRVGAACPVPVTAGQTAAAA